MPRLHLVTDDAVLADERFGERASRLMATWGADIALHLRGPGTSARRLFDLAASLAEAAGESGSLVLVNDRADVALAAGARGVQLPGGGLPVAALRSLSEEWVIGVSTHGPGEVARAEVEGADFVLLGTIWPTPSHPGRPGAGLERVRRACEGRSIPVIAIGGVTPERAGMARAAGAHGVAVLRGVWSAADPAAAAGTYIEAISGAE